VRAFLDSHSEVAVTNPEFVHAVLSIDLEHRLTAGDGTPLIEDYLDVARRYNLSEDHLLNLGRQDYQGRWERGEITARRDEYRRIFSHHASEIDGWRPRWSCPSCHRENIPLGDETYCEATCPRCQATFAVEHLFRPSPALDMRDYGRVRDLGIGGMGEVFESRDPTLNRTIAVKVIHEAYRGNPEMERRFLREARITGRLQHPAIVPIHGLGRLPDGRLFYTMKLVGGKTLEHWLRTTTPEARNIPGSDMIAVFTQVCDALAYAHEKNIVHRDMKPSNVMVGSFGEVQVMDWGLAKELATPSSDSQEPSDDRAGRDANGNLTCVGEWLGTLLYMAPEQARREVDRISKPSDVFSLGAFLCEILTGLPPYQKPGETWLDSNDDWLKRAQRGDVSAGLDRLRPLEKPTDPALSHLVKLARDILNPDPEKRPPDAKVVAQRLHEYPQIVQREAHKAIASRAKQDELEKRLEAERKEAAAIEAERVQLAKRLEAETKEAAAKEAELKAEKKARRRQTVATVLGGLVLVMLGVSTWVVIDLARRRAVADRDRATAEKKAADATTRQAIADRDRATAELEAQTQYDLVQKQQGAIALLLANASTWTIGRTPEQLEERLRLEDRIWKDFVTAPPNASPGIRALYASLAEELGGDKSHSAKEVTDRWARARALSRDRAAFGHLTDAEFQSLCLGTEFQATMACTNLIGRLMLDWGRSHSHDVAGLRSTTAKLRDAAQALERSIESLDASVQQVRRDGELTGIDEQVIGELVDASLKGESIAFHNVAVYCVAADSVQERDWRLLRDAIRYLKLCVEREKLRRSPDPAVLSSAYFYLYYLLDTLRPSQEWLWILKEAVRLNPDLNLAESWWRIFPSFKLEGDELVQTIKVPAILVTARESFHDDIDGPKWIEYGLVSIERLRARKAASQQWYFEMRKNFDSLLLYRATTESWKATTLELFTRGALHELAAHAESLEQASKGDPQKRLYGYYNSRERARCRSLILKLAAGRNRVDDQVPTSVHAEKGFDALLAYVQGGGHINLLEKDPDFRSLLEADSERSRSLKLLQARLHPEVKHEVERVLHALEELDKMDAVFPANVFAAG